MRKQLYIDFLIVMMIQILQAQNIVPNSSFENFYHLNELPRERLSSVQASQFRYQKDKPLNENDCPLYGVWTYLFCKDWTNCSSELNSDTPDLYNKCSIQEGVPFSYIVFPNQIKVTTYQNTKSGYGYMGIGVLDGRIGKYWIGWKEFIQTKLIKPLQTGRIYYADFYVNRADFSTVSTDRLGLYFSNKEIKVKDGKQMFNYKPQVFNPVGKAIEDTVNWVKVSGMYVAKGGEQYIIIGDFYPEKENTIKYNEKKSKDFICYYFIDDVSVVPVDSTDTEGAKTDIPLPLPKNTITNDKELFRIDSVAVGSAVILKNIAFEPNKSELLPASFAELDKLVSLLGANLTLKIDVQGHTDDTGTDEYNMKLSVARAKAVVDYLISHGIGPARLTYKGFGRTKPLTDNKTTEGKAKNRRVELVIIDK
jgi:OmpA-OmpF porin, OOP family